MVKNLTAMWKTCVFSLGWEDPLEKEMAIHSRTIAWKIPWIEEPGRLQPMGLQRVGHDSATSLYFTPWKDSYDQPRQHIKKQKHYSVDKGLPSQSYGFSSGHV